MDSPPLPALVTVHALVTHVCRVASVQMQAPSAILSIRHCDRLEQATHREASDERRARYGWNARLWSDRARGERATLSCALGGARLRHSGAERRLLHYRCVPAWHRAHGADALSTRDVLRTLARDG